MEFLCIWYDLDQEVKRDVVEADNSEDASNKVYLKYGGHAPAPCLSITALNSHGGDVGGYFQTRW